MDVVLKILVASYFVVVLYPPGRPGRGRWRARDRFRSLLAARADVDLPLGVVFAGQHEKRGAHRGSPGRVVVDDLTDLFRCREEVLGVGDLLARKMRWCPARRCTSASRAGRSHSSIGAAWCRTSSPSPPPSRWEGVWLAALTVPRRVVTRGLG